MGNETILYYVLEETITGCKRNVKAHFWRKVKPLSFLTEQNGLSIVTVMIPAINKAWKREKLLDIMREGISEYPDYAGNADIIIHPELQQLLMQEDSFIPVFWELARRLLEENFLTEKRTESKASIGSKRYSSPESVVLLMGDAFFPEEQMQQFTDMMHPYFPRINKLTVIYEADDEGWGDADENMYGDMLDRQKYSDIGMDSRKEEFDVEFSRKNGRWEETISDCMEMLYYEYGLVAGLYRGEDYREKGSGIIGGQHPTLYLDYGYKGKLPLSMMRMGGIYIDVLSSAEKEQRIRKKCSEISYLSPRKYLDTMVKSGYDKLVNLAGY